MEPRVSTEVDITVIHPNGQKIKLKVSNSTTYQEVKSKLRMKTSSDLDNFDAVLGGQTLSESVPLREYDISGSSIIELVPRKAASRKQKDKGHLEYNCDGSNWFLDVSSWNTKTLYVSSIAASNSAATFRRSDGNENIFTLERGLPWMRTVELVICNRDDHSYQSSRSKQVGLHRIHFSLMVSVEGQAGATSFAGTYYAQEASNLVDWLRNSVAQALRVQSLDILEIRHGLTRLDNPEAISVLQSKATVKVFTAPIRAILGKPLDSHLQFVFKLVHFNSIDLDILGRIGKSDVKNIVWFIPLILKMSEQAHCQVSEASKKKLETLLRKYQFLGQTTAWLLKTINCTKHPLNVALDAATDKAFLELAKQQGPMENIKVENVQILDPVYSQKRGACHVIEKLQVVKVFTSQAKPCLIKASYVASEDSASKAKEGLFILKRGDDLRVDLMTQTMFYIFNRVWAQANLPHAPYCFLFKVIPMALDYGVVECVSGCTTLQEYDWTKWGLLDQSEKWKFLCSAAGGYTAGWILGIRDRHKENMMVKDDHIFVQIDFGHMFDRKTKYFDAPRFAVPSTMRSTISPEEWSAFKELCVDGFKILRRMGTTVVDLTCVRISPPVPQSHKAHISLCSQGLYEGIGLVNMQEVKEFMLGRSSLMLDMSEDEACQRIRDLIESGASSGWKYIKNAGHVVAHAFK